MSNLDVPHCPSLPRWRPQPRPLAHMCEPRLVPRGQSPPPPGPRGRCQPLRRYIYANPGVGCHWAAGLPAGPRLPPGPPSIYIYAHPGDTWRRAGRLRRPAPAPRPPAAGRGQTYIYYQRTRRLVVRIHTYIRYFRANVLMFYHTTRLVPSSSICICEDARGGPRPPRGCRRRPGTRVRGARVQGSHPSRSICIYDRPPGRPRAPGPVPGTGVRDTGGADQQQQAPRALPIGFRDAKLMPPSGASGS